MPEDPKTAADTAYVGPRFYAAFRAELAASQAQQEPDFGRLNSRKQKRLLNRARRLARSRLREYRGPSIAAAVANLADTEDRR